MPWSFYCRIRHVLAQSEKCKLTDKLILLGTRMILMVEYGRAITWATQGLVLRWILLIGQMITEYHRMCWGLPARQTMLMILCSTLGRRRMPVISSRGGSRISNLPGLDFKTDVYWSLANHRKPVKKHITSVHFSNLQVHQPLSQY